MRVNRSIRVLIVAPEHVTIDLQQQVAGCLPDDSHIDCTGTGRQAVQLANESDWDLCLLASQVADCSGLSLLETFRQVHPEMPIVALTTVVGDPITERMLVEGAHAAIVAPVEAEELQAVLDLVFDSGMILLNESPVAILRFDHDQRVTKAGGGLLRQATISPHQLIGCSLTDLAEKLPLAAKHFQRALDGRLTETSGQVAGRSCQLIWQRLASGDVQVTITAAEGGRVVMPQRDYLAVTSHDIRTLMSSIIGMTDLLLETDVDEEQAHYIDRFRRAGNTMLWLIDNMLELSRMEAGRQPLHSAPFVLREVIDDMVAIMSYRAEQKGLELKIEVASGLPARYVGDAKRLGQILLNLVSNAIKFTEAGHILVSFAARDNGLRIQVADTGQGIPAEMLERVFERYTQTREGSDQGGSGLGLAIVRQLVDLMGGAIKAESPPGKGAVFTVDLPMAVAPAERSLPPPPPPPPPSSGATRARNPLRRHALDRKDKEPSTNVHESVRPMQVLLAEDTADTRVLIEHFLMKTQHKLDLAENGEEAVKRFKEQDYDLVLMDIQMPVMDGFEATAAIRQLEELEDRKTTPIVALTAHAMTHDRSRCLAAGCTDYLAKPVRKQQILQLIATYAKQEG